MISGVIFDLDDTLYMEREYVRSGFYAVAVEVSSHLGCTYDEFFAFLWGIFEAGIRGNNFDRLLEAYPQVKRKFSTNQLIDIYRTHKPELQLSPDTDKILRSLSGRGFRLGIISDGPLASQVAKINALGLESLVDLIILTDSWGREFWKPHPKGYEVTAQTLNIPHSKLCYVADNPEKDFCTPNKIGWQTIRVRKKGQLRFDINPSKTLDAPNITVNGLAELQDYLNRFK